MTKLPLARDRHRSVPGGVSNGAAFTSPGLRVGGLEPFTSTDYPGALAGVIFCQGCPWNCAYCHNPHLIRARGDDELDFGQILAWLKSRCGLLDAVVFSGGEPTSQGELGGAIDAVRDLGYAVGLHTGGAYPRRLAQLLPRVDWAAIDVKAPAAEYAKVTGISGSGKGAFECLDLVRKSGVAHEVRTTVHPLLTPPDSLERLARELAARGVERWVLQGFRATGCANEALVAAVPKRASFDRAILMRLAEHIPVIDVRI